MILTKFNKHSWLYQIWQGLDEYRAQCNVHDNEWDEITTAMAWIEEELGIQYDHNQ